MREMIRKIGSFFEQHVEKIVLGIVGLVCIWLLFARVIFSQNVVSYDNKSFGPSGIDAYIEERARELQTEIKQPATSSHVYQARLSGPVGPNDLVRQGVWGNLNKGFGGLLDSAIAGVDRNVYPPLPMYTLDTAASKREYRLPTIGEVTDVAVEHIRAVAYVPTQDVTEQLTYDKAGHEPNDIDLVTVEAKFDIAGLYRRFYSCFAGEDVKEEAWRDPCLARPVFAAVQLQRSVQRAGLLEDDNWSDWEDVPMTKIDAHKRLFEIVDDVDSLPPGGIKVRMLQYSDKQVTMDLLQPTAYQIASAKEEWFPPTLHREFIDLQKKEDMETRRDEAAKAKEGQGTGTDERTGRQPGRRTPPDRGAGGTRGGGAFEGSGATGDPYGGQDLRRSRRSTGDRPDAGRTTETGRLTDRGRTGTSRTRTGRTTDTENLYLMPERTDVKPKPSTADVYDEFDVASINVLTDMSKMKEPLLFWAHDDSVEPGNTYRYRIRLGVFNPVAGTNQVAKEDAKLKKQAILWSDFSDVTEPVDVPQMLYFFAKEVQETEKKVTVEVSRYAMGYWRSKEFPVTVGEMIGKVVEADPSEGRTTTRRNLSLPGRPEVNPRNNPRPGSPDSVFGPGLEGVGEPDSVDYRTGAVLLDLVETSDWSGPGSQPDLVRNKSIRQRVYHDALYTFDGATIEHTPVRVDNWPKELAARYQDIKNSQRQPQEPLRAWNAKTRRTRELLPGPYEGAEGYYDEMRPMGEGQRLY